MKFRKKPVVIDAVQFDGDNFFDLCAWASSFGERDSGFSQVNEKLAVMTLEGQMTASIGDWIIRGVNGEFYPCKPDIDRKSVV